jgi:uncharacterized protein YggE
MRTILLLLLVLGGSAVAAEAPERFVTVQAKGHVEAIPDTLQLTVSVKKTGSELSQVRPEVDALTSRVIGVALKQGVAEDDIDSSQLRVWPEYEWRKSQRYYLGDSVQRDIVLRIRDLEQYSQLVKKLTQLPLHQLHPPQLGHSKLEDLRLQALRAALVQGEQKARAIAQGIDAELGPVIYVEERSTSSPAPQRMMMAEAASSNGGGEPAFSLAKQRISAQVEIRYSLL